MRWRRLCLAPLRERTTYGGVIAVLPMFPLGTVLLPGAVLPLHVFEPRYRQLVVDCLAADDTEPEFGVTLIERGWEVGGGDERANVGTVARMVRVEALDAGRYALVAVGTRRIRVDAWLPDDPYPIAEISDWPDDPVDQALLRERAAAATTRLRELLVLAARLGEAPADVDLGMIHDDPVIATYHLAALAPVGPADTYRLLCAPDPLARIDVLTHAFDDVEAVMRFRLAEPPA